MNEHFVVTANRLDDGGVAYLGEGRWVSDLGEAWVTSDRALADDRLRWARGREGEVCDPYVVEIRLRRGVPSALSARERIRAEGPLCTLQRLGYR